MSILFTNSQDFPVNVDFFTTQPEFESVEEQLIADHPFHPAPSGLVTPPPKRRRGRPPKVSSGQSNTQPGAAASAAVIKQGTPQTTSPLMRVSPLRNKKSIGSSPLQMRMVNPSPKGGLLMRLDSAQNEDSLSKPKKSTPRSSAKSKSKQKALQKHQNMAGLSSSPSISSTTQEKIQSLTLSSGAHSSSVNPSLLLSSPLSSSKIRELQLKRTPNAKNVTHNRTAMNPPASTIPLNSSPMTPLASSYSSCFSSIIQSSPLYQGYYVNNSSPSTSVLNSSPVRYQMKPIPSNTQQMKNVIDEFPKNPENSPILKPQTEDYFGSSTTSSSKHTSFDQENKPSYKVSLSIDETGQATITKIKRTPQQHNQLKSKPQQELPKFTRHESLMNISTSELSKYSAPSNQPQPPLPTRSNSTPQLDTYTTHHHQQQQQYLQEDEDSPLGSNSSDFEMFIEPSRMTNAFFYDEMNTDFTGTTHVDLSSLNDQPTEVFHTTLGGPLKPKSTPFNEDDESSYDARKALIKMLRRSI